MTNRDWAVLGFRLLCVWLATGLITNLAYFRYEHPNPFIAAWVVQLVIVLSLWKWAEGLASRVFPNVATADLTLEGRWDEELLVLALLIMGLYLTAAALGNIAGGVVWVFVGSGVTRSVFGTPVSPEIVASVAKAKALLVQDVVQLFVGGVLVFYSRGVAAALVGLSRGVSLTDSSGDEEQEPDGEEGQAGEDDRI